MTTQIGRDKITEILVANITGMQLGEDGTDVADSNTDLGLADATTMKVPTVEMSGDRFTLRHSINTTEGNGKTFREAGVYIDGVLLDRVVYPDYNKTSQVELTTLEIFKVR